MSLTAVVERADEQVEQFERDGYYIARGLLSSDEVQYIKEVFQAQAEKGCVPGLFDGVDTPAAAADPLIRYPRMMHPHRRPDFEVGKVALRYLLDSRVEEYLSRFMGDEPVAAQSMYYFKPPGARGQALHQDNFYLRVAPGTCMAAWIAIDDTDAENGSLMGVPGSHQLDIICPQQADLSESFSTEYVAPPAGYSVVELAMKGGDVLFFNGSLIHGSYPNRTTDRFRCALINHYLPRSSAEISHWYRPLVGFDGNEIEYADAEGGGPCGTTDLSGTVH